ncbi:unnamed protein product [Paramecium sonneborni]|uniref:Uncharacterized protein n=1 Tax=Paramecium sonneborni TaxID=65129 RepID=A0A8S1RCD9_9CILI|nr:unnamed protein product [Paramecium sonneborni]
MLAKFDSINYTIFLQRKLIICKNKTNQKMVHSKLQFQRQKISNGFNNIKYPILKFNSANIHIDIINPEEQKNNRIKQCLKSQYFIQINIVYILIKLINKQIMPYNLSVKAFSDNIKIYGYNILKKQMIKSKQSSSIFLSILSDNNRVVLFKIQQLIEKTCTNKINIYLIRIEVLIQIQQSQTKQRLKQYIIDGFRSQHQIIYWD